MKYCCPLIIRFFLKEFVKPFLPITLLNTFFPSGCHLAGYFNSLQRFCLSYLLNCTTFLLFFCMKNCFHLAFWIYLSLASAVTFCPTPQQAGTAAKEGHKITVWNECWRKWCYILFFFLKMESWGRWGVFQIPFVALFNGRNSPLSFAGKENKFYFPDLSLSVTGLV